MPFGVVSGTVDGWVYDVEGEMAVMEVNLGRPIVTNRDFVA